MTVETAPIKVSAWTGVRAWLVTAACAALGVLIGFAFVGWDLEQIAPHALENPGTAYSAEENRYFLTVLLMLVAAVVAHGVLPWALRHVPAERDPDYPGARSALVTTCIVCVCAFSYFTIPATCVALVSVFTRRSTAWSVAAVVAVAVSFGVDAALVQYSTRDYDPWTLLGVPLVVIPAMLVGTARGRRRERRERLEAEARLVKAQLVAREEAARQAERERIARDMHDSLSHRLSLIALHAGALSFREDLPREKVAVAAGTIRAEAQAAVEELRHVLGALRETAPLPTVEQLVQDHRAADGPINVTGELPPLDALAAQTVARAVQEGLTNARKHAPGEPVTLELGVRERGARDSGARGRIATVEMRNAQVHGEGGARSANAATGAATGAGQGLLGLAERARLAGGSFEVTHGPEFGWRLELPAQGEEEN